MIRGYNSYQENTNLINALREYSRETDKNKTQLFFSKKYNIPIATFKRYYKKYKSVKINGGNMNDIIPPSKEQQQIFKKKEKMKEEQKKVNEEQSKNFMNFFDNNYHHEQKQKEREQKKENKCKNTQKAKPQNLFNELNKMNPEFTKYD